MKQHMYRALVFLSLICLLVGSCKKDKGNYKYKELNTLQVIKGLSPEVVATFGQTLEITPQPQFSQDPDFDETKYTYDWSYIGSNGMGGTMLISLGKTKNLNHTITIAPGSYAAYYSITEQLSGVKYTTSFRLKVVNEINEGWFMLNEVRGEARVDVLSLNPNGGFDLIIDILDYAASGLKLSGKPVMAYAYETGQLLGPDAISYGLYFGTDQGTTKIDPNSFKWTPTMSLSYEMFGQVPTGFYAEAIQQRYTHSAHMVGHGNIYYYDRPMNTYYATPINYIDAEQKEFEVAPFIAGNHMFLFANTIFYDKTNRRFVRHGWSGNCTTIPDPDNKLFSFSTGMDLVYMQWVPYNGGEVFAILQHPSSKKRYLARFNPENNVQSYYAELLGTGIDKAEFFTINPEFGYIFYAVDSKIYEYDMNYKTAKQMIDLGNKKLSYLHFYPFNDYKYKDGNKLMVGSYDPNKNDGTEGSLAIYTVPGINENLVLDKSYTGFGRIKALTYRERK